MDPGGIQDSARPLSWRDLLGIMMTQSVLSVFSLLEAGELREWVLEELAWVGEHTVETNWLGLQPNVADSFADPKA